MAKIAKAICWCKGFLPHCSQSSEPIASKDDEDNGKLEKKRKYNQQILDNENGTSTPLVFTTNVGMSRETKQFYRRLSQLLREKSDVNYSDTSTCVKRQISLSLL